MKKALIAIISAIYVVAIIVVAFLGVRAQVITTTTLVESIEIDDLYNKESGSTYTFEAGNSKIYTAYKRPDDSLIDPNEHKDSVNKIIWDDYQDNKLIRKIDYAVRIYNFNYIYDSNEWRDGATKFAINAKAYPRNATNLGLIYTIFGVDESYISIDKDGIMTFNSNTQGTKSFTLAITSTDKQSLTVYVKFTVRGYTTSI